MRGEKREIIQKLKFTGLLKLPRLLPFTSCLVNRQFCLWLMRKVDVQRSEINLGPRGRIPMTPRDVNRILAIPWKGKIIDGEKQNNYQEVKAIIRNYLLLNDSDALDLATIQKLLAREYPACMNDDQRRCFTVAAVIYAVSYFLAPKGRPPKINNEVLPFLVDYNNIRHVNWSEYVLRVLLDSCSKVQSDICSEQSSVILDGCLLVLQVSHIHVFKQINYFHNGVTW